MKRHKKPALSDQQQSFVFRAAARRVAATATLQPDDPMAELPAAVAKMPLYGAFVSLKSGGRLRSCCGFIGESIPLADAVDRSAVRAAKDDPRFPPIAPDELDELNMEVWLLWNPKPVAARGKNRIKAITIGRHGVQIAMGAARGLLLPGVAVEYNLDAEGFLQQVCLKAGLPPDAWKSDEATVMTFEGYSLGGRLTDALARQTTPTQDIRPPAVAGAFYPDVPAELDRQLDEMLSVPRPSRPCSIDNGTADTAVARPCHTEPWPAAMVPHAGWMYSGRLAAEVLSRIDIPDRVIIFSPRHHPGGAEWAVAPYDAWALPGRRVLSDPELAEHLAESIDAVVLDAEAHSREHSIEVQLPIIARLAPDARVVGVAIGGGEPADLLRFGRQLADVLSDMPDRPLLVISSDMNHFADDAETRRLDHLVLDAMATLDPAKLYETVRSNRISMCGILPAVIVMETLRRLDLLSRIELVDYATSADASGDTQRVVGYAGLLLG